MRANWSHPLQAKIAAMIMRFWGVQVEVHETQLRLVENVGKGGFEFFVKLYDGRIE